MSTGSFASSEIPTVGYVSVTFPRDPVSVNQFNEHMVLGQILEPLVAADQLGNTIPGIAASWTFLDQGLSIEFKLNHNVVFSNGKSVEASDVRASLMRHATSNSQSGNFLKTIRDIEVVDKWTVLIHLKEKNVSILKALSRDQLGIMPAGWHFDVKSNEPIIGSGPYRLIKRDGSWFLEKNDSSKAVGSNGVPKWKLIFYKNEEWDLPEGPLPDFAPTAKDTELKVMKKSPDFIARGFATKPRTSFTQTSAWWYPHGNHYDAEMYRSNTMAAISEVMTACIPQLGYEPATGVIPVGVAGFLPQLPERKRPLHPLTPPISIKIAMRSAVFADLLDCADAKKIFETRNIRVEKLLYTSTSLVGLKEHKPDVLMASWAGGFNDPEGFLPILNSFLSVDFVTYLKDLAPLYHSARQEQNWTKRAELFRSFNKALIDHEMMVPGWRVPMYSVTAKGLDEPSTDLRYTPHFASVHKK